MTEELSFFKTELQAVRVEIASNKTAIETNTEVLKDLEDRLNRCTDNVTTMSEECEHGAGSIA